jgi:hypothetical protein
LLGNTPERWSEEEKETADQRPDWVEAWIRSLEEKWARNEPKEAERISDLLNGPQRLLSAEEIASEVRRLLVLCAREGVEAVYREACTCRELLLALAIACHNAGLIPAGQYLDYLVNPWE